MQTVLCLNGPNLDLLGTRQPDVYGDLTLDELASHVEDWGRRLGFDVEFVQSNDEGELIGAVHSARHMAGVVLNPGALTHYSFALRDAIASIDTPVVEVHLSNVRSRDRWRRYSVITEVADASIYGRGAEGYRAALRHLVNRAAAPVSTSRYGPHPDQLVDFRATPASRGAILVHGGFWRDAWARDVTESWAVDLVGRGFGVANLEYRRLGSGGDSTATVADVSEAISRAGEHVGRLAVIGHSAGAQLTVAALAEVDIQPQAVVLVSGVLDFDAAAADGLGDDAVAEFDPGHRLDPLRLPVPSCPVVLVHGDADTVVPPDQSRAYQRHLEERGRPPSAHFVAGAGHFDALDSRSELWHLVASELDRLV